MFILETKVSRGIDIFENRVQVPFFFFFISFYFFLFRDRIPAKRGRSRDSSTRVNFAPRSFFG